MQNVGFLMTRLKCYHMSDVALSQRTMSCDKFNMITHFMKMSVITMQIFSAKMSLKSLKQIKSVTVVNGQMVLILL